jgi:hypothetical protein
MEPTSAYRPRVSRETRRLLTAGVLAVVALSLLARLRFQDLPTTPNPIPAVLRQLDARVKYTDLAGEIAQLQPNLNALLVAVDRATPDAGASGPASLVVALRSGRTLAVALLPAEPAGWTTPVVARDPASGLAVVEVPDLVSGAVVSPWTPRSLEQPRYLIGSDRSPAGISARPIFVGSLDTIDSPLWEGAVWAVPQHTDVSPGSFLFTSNAELVGMVFEDARARAIVPAATLLAAAERLVSDSPSAPAPLGVDVQPLTEPVKAATGAAMGVVVTWVDPEGPGAGRLTAGDVIEAIDRQPLSTERYWDARVARLTAGETLNLDVRRRGELLEVAVTAAAPPAAPSRPLGLTLRARPPRGAEVTAVARHSAAERAGLRAGDVITLAGDAPAPTPAQVTRTFGAATTGQRVLLAVSRGDTHFVTALAR